MVCPLLTTSALLFVYLKSRAGKALFFALRMSMGDCSLPSLHAEKPASISPHFLGPCSPPYPQWGASSAACATNATVISKPVATTDRIFMLSVLNTSKCELSPPWYYTRLTRNIQNGFCAFYYPPRSSASREPIHSDWILSLCLFCASRIDND